MSRWGEMAGVGLEYALQNNLSVKIEYDYMDFGRQRVTLEKICGGCTTSPYDIEQTIQLVKVGLNYRFNFGGPTATRY